MSTMYLILVILLGASFQPMYTPDMHDLLAITLCSFVELMNTAQPLKLKHVKRVKLAKRFAIITTPCTPKFMSGLTVTLINLGVQPHQSKLRLPRISSLT